MHGFVGQLIPVALMYIVGLQIDHQLEGLAHGLDFDLRVGEDLVLLVIEVMLLEVRLDAGALEDQVVEHDLLPRDFLPVVEVQLDLGPEVPDFLEGVQAFLALFDLVEHGLLHVVQIFTFVNNNDVSTSYL